MTKGFWVLVVATLGLATSTGVAVGQGNSESSNGTDNRATSQVQPTQANGKAVGLPTPTTTTTTPSTSSGVRSTAGTSGNPTQPQPLSNADLNKGGANNGGNCAPYCSTRDGSPSENGNGGGQATGKPCAGCVGKADNKRPEGQLPNAASDGNRGYECDDNKGIGKGNPAHTGCQPPPPPRTTIVPPLVTVQGVTQAPALVPASNPVLGEREASPREVAEDEALREQRNQVVAARPGAARELAFTGLSLVWIALLGVGFLAIGHALHRQGVLAGSAYEVETGSSREREAVGAR